MHCANNAVIMQTEQLGWIKALEEELQSSRVKMTDLEQKLTEQDQVIAQLVVIVFSSLRLRCTMILYTSTTVDLYPFFIGHYPFPFSPGSLRPFLYSHPSSLPLLTRLPQYQVTVHLSVIADPDIAEVTRLASPPYIIHSLLPLTATPSRDLHVTGL